MNSSLREKINDFADIIRNEYNIGTPIQNMSEVVERLRGELVEVPMLENFADAQVQKKGHSFEICVSSLDSDERKRFSIAHEIGHLFLHMGYEVDDELWESNENNKLFRLSSGEMEYQAHEFAAAFLMPKAEFIAKMNENRKEDGNYNIAEVAEFFKVSVEAASNRGKWLGILSWR